MMPTCSYKGCSKVATTRLGEVNTGRKDGFGEEWPETVYVCPKHHKKVCKKLGLIVEEEKCKA